MPEMKLSILPSQLFLIQPDFNQELTPKLPLKHVSIIFGLVKLIVSFRALFYTISRTTSRRSSISVTVLNFRIKKFALKLDLTQLLISILYGMIYLLPTGIPFWQMPKIYLTQMTLV